MPWEMEEAALLHETGWAPDVLDAVDEGLLQRYLLYKKVMDVNENGGTLTFQR